MLNTIKKITNSFNGFINNKNQVNDNDKAFSIHFDEAEEISSLDIYENRSCKLDDSEQYYQPPVAPKALANLLYINAYHGTILEFKKNIVISDFIASNAISFKDMENASFDFLTFNNMYFKVITNYYGEVIKLEHLPAIKIRRLKKPNAYGFLEECDNTFSTETKIKKLNTGEVIHIKNYAPHQTIYGLPIYLGATVSIMLNRESILYRRRYYNNNGHTGFIFYSTAAGFSKEAQKLVKEQIGNSKGRQSCKNIFLHIPNAKEKDIQILPIGDFSTKDEIEKIKNISRDDMLAVHRMPPALASVVPSQGVSFGDIEKIDRIYTKNEILPIRRKMLEINEYLKPELQVSFKDLAEN